MCSCVEIQLMKKELREEIRKITPDPIEKRAITPEPALIKKTANADNNSAPLEPVLQGGETL